MNVAELQAVLAEYPDAMRVLIEDRDGWLDERIDVEQMTINQLGIGDAESGEKVVVLR